MPILVDQFGTPLSSVSLTDNIYVDTGSADGRAAIQKVYDLFSNDVFGFDVQSIIRNPLNGLFFFSDYLEQHVTMLGTGVAGGGLRGKGTYGENATKKALGVSQLSVATAGTARVTSYLNAQGAFPVGLGKLLYITRVAFTDLSTATEEFHAEFGITSGYTAAAGMPYGVAWGYQREIDGDFWVVVTGVSPTQTKTVTSIPVTTNYIWLAYTVNAAWTSVTFYYSADGISWTSLAPHTTNIPTSGSYNFSVAGQAGKTAGNTARLIHCDLSMLVYFFNR